MKTTELIELQRSITQGKWKRDDDELFRREIISQDAQWIVTVHSWNTASKSVQPSEAKANATAIALVPELLAEVIRLREALGTVSELLDCGNIEQSHWDDALDTARAALADDK